MDHSELKRYKNYKVDFKKIEFITGRILLKSLLGKILELPGRDVKLKQNEYGKLFLCPVNYPNQIYFNLSHAEDLVACVISSNNEVGIDIEKITKKNLEIMSIVFTSNEIEFVNSYSNLDEKVNAFYLIWTRKEALLKAKGKGFYLKPKNYSVPQRFNDTSDSEYYYYSVKLHLDYFCSVVTSNTNNKILEISQHFIDFDKLF